MSDEIKHGTTFGKFLAADKHEAELWDWVKREMLYWVGFRAGRGAQNLGVLGLNGRTLDSVYERHRIECADTPIRLAAAYIEFAWPELSGRAAWDRFRLEAFRRWQNRHDENGCHCEERDAVESLRWLCRS